MATKEELKNISTARIRSAEVLIQAEDWEGAGQMMGLALECALKAASCTTLGINSYPETHSRDKEVGIFFKTHSFDRLLLLSGLSELFSAAGDPKAFENWSVFTTPYPAKGWVEMRYNGEGTGPFDRPTVEKLFRSLYGDEVKGVVRVIAQQKWSI